MPWRDQYTVHPGADVFPMMSDDELAELGEDIAENRLQNPIKLMYVSRARKIGENVFEQETMLPDDRNRLEAMERAGIDIEGCALKYQYVNTSRGPFDFDAAAYVISANIRRRHLSKAQQAELIVAAVKAGEKPLQVDEVSKGGRGKVNKAKAKAVEIAAANGISKSTVERAIAKSEGRKPNTGCNYDPADPRGEDDAETERVIRRRAWLNMAESAREQAESFFGGDHRAIAKADPAEIDEEIIDAA